MPENNDIDKSLEGSLSRLEQKLIGELQSGCCWRGKLSSSALSTAVAMFALSKVDPVKYGGLVQKAARWLLENANQDGGWGDTPESPSNISTTLLAWSALSVVEHGQPYEKLIENAGQYIRKTTGTLEPADISRTILGHYGKDRTFSVPILTMCALAGRLGKDGSEWDHVIQLPFEISVLPRCFFRLIGLPVVSYALPALIAMGMLRHRKARKYNLVMKIIRDMAAGRSLEVLRNSLPSSGGFLEAIPLTGFVTMSLVAAGCRDESIIGPCSGFLEKSFREDGSCPIDTNLATWLTTLSIKAMGGAGGLGAEKADAVEKWLTAQQYRDVHPFTGAAPGGWAWTDLPGGVPDADDTSGALIALKLLNKSSSWQSVSAGIDWLIDLQNSDGGMPTFCRGWGRLPFDRSCPEITAHMLEAFSCWRNEMDDARRESVDASMARGLGYLRKSQKDDGSWMPLWFGNQSAKDHGNPTYGTSRVLIGLSALNRTDFFSDEIRLLMISRAAVWLVKAQNPDNGWGGDIGLPTTVEETALAVNALSVLPITNPEIESAKRKGIDKLIELADGCDLPPASPIGLYFSMLWYSERLYPLIFTVTALKTASTRKHY
ncbi:MAG TPA: squalene--hopene cyclase [Lentisphaeria bacterium]|nr:squalene--hopene cyclase [Lentisphaeria bacterium]